MSDSNPTPNGLTNSIKFVNPELNVAISKADPRPGSILIAHPKHPGDKFTPDFCLWLSKQLAEMLPVWSKAMIIATDVVRFDNIHSSIPARYIAEREKEAYIDGWSAAFQALEDLCKGDDT